MSKSQLGGDAAVPRSLSAYVAMCGTIFLMALLMAAPARGFAGDDKNSAGKDTANKDATNKDNKTTENSNLTDREILQQLLQQIQLLQTRVAELEAKESLARPNQPAPSGGCLASRWFCSGSRFGHARSADNRSADSICACPSGGHRDQ